MYGQRRRKIRPAILNQDHPVIVCLCGSVRFLDQFGAASLAETLAGRIVLSVGSHLYSDAEIFAALTVEEKQAASERLAGLHRHKIDLANKILVVNVGGYVGDNTRSEIEYARQTGKRVRWLESQEEGRREP